MKRTIAGIAFALLAAAGCRQQDVRDFSVSLPAMNEANAAEIEKDVRAALAMYRGVDKSTLACDAAARQVDMKYDSMQVAQKNIEFAIAKAGWTANDVTPESVGAKAKSK